AGLDSIDVLVDLRAAHEESPYMGLDVFDGEVVDMKEEGVLEPQRVKKQAIQSAAEAAEMILRIDDMIAAKGFDVSSKDQEDMEGMGGMGGMPPMM
ncbi:TCP-1/cpn60 chaperonin family protein, partial [Methanothermobacter sp.]